MESEMKDPVLVRLNNQIFLLYRFKRDDGNSVSMSFRRTITCLLVARQKQPTIPVLCLIFTKGPLLWKDQSDIVYEKNENIQYGLANLLPHLNINIEKMIAMSKLGEKCFYFNFSNDDNKNGFTESSINTYYIPTETSFFDTARNIVFPRGVENISARSSILKILESHSEYYPETKMSLSELYASLPLTDLEFKKQLVRLREDHRIDVNSEPGDETKVLTLRINSRGQAELEGNLKPGVESGQMSQHIYGSQFNSTTLGDNSPIINTIQYSTVFNQVREELERRSEPNDIEIKQTLNELEEEVGKPGKDISKIKMVFEKLKKLAEWSTKLLGPIVGKIILSKLGFPA